MGYTTEFSGEITITPPLNEKEIEYIRAFNDSRRMDRENGPYFVGDDTTGFDIAPDVRDHNRPPEGQPGLWCQWTTNDEGTVIEWDGGEKFYSPTEWMQYIIDHFLGQNPIAKMTNKHFDFLQGHTLNGEILAEGEESGDIWKLFVKDNVVTAKDATISFD